MTNQQPNVLVQKIWRRTHSVVALSIGFVWYLVATFTVMALSFLMPRRPIINHFYGRILAYPMLPILGFKIKLDGFDAIDAAEPCVLIGNHQSSLDMFIYGTLTRRMTVYIGKVELLFVPLFGWLFWAAGNILIRRQDNRHAVRGLNQARDAMLQRKVNIWIFPEGTRSRGKALLLPFKRGAFYMAIAAQRPLVAFVSEPLENYYDYKRKLIKPGEVRVKILPPYETKGLTKDDANALLERVRADMLKALEEMRATRWRGPPPKDANRQD
jgi:1-acyl-sn-glycerol-3-phosphate acyltransferase